MYYAISRRRRTVAHLAPAKFAPALCKRFVDMTSNFNAGKRICKDCERIAAAAARKARR